jgi:SAM-dependent methyltransferase
MPDIIYQPTKGEVKAAFTGDKAVLRLLSGIEPMGRRSRREYKPLFDFEFEPNYMPSTLTDPLREVWAARGVGDRIVVDLGCGLGGTELMLSKDPLVKLAVGVDMNPDCIRFARFLASKYANHPEVISCLTSVDGIRELAGRYNANALGVKWVTESGYENVLMPVGSFAPTRPTRPCISTDPRNVPLHSLIEVLEWKGRVKPHPPTREEAAKMLFIQSDGIHYPVPANSAHAVICIDSAQWQDRYPNTRNALKGGRDPMMEAVLRIAKKGALLHIHSRAYKVGGSRSCDAQAHLKRIAGEKDIELEDLGPTFYEMPLGMCGERLQKRARLFRVKKK